MPTLRSLFPAFGRGFLIALALAVPLAAAPAEPAEPPPPALHRGLDPIDEAFDIRLDLIASRDGNPAAFAYLEKEFTRHPRPHLKAWYAQHLIEGRAWGAPEGQAERGMVLARQAWIDGSIHATCIIGWEMLSGRHLKRDVATGEKLLRKAALTGNTNAMETLGDAYMRGIGVKRDLQEAEYWLLRAAWQGKPNSLIGLAETWEQINPPDRAKSAMLYYEAAIRGSSRAEKTLRALVAAGDVAGSRACRLMILTQASVGMDFTRKEVRTALTTLLAEYPRDPLVLFAAARIYSSNEFVSVDMKHAAELYRQAAELGSDDAAADEAWLQAEGWGVPKDPAHAVAVWQELAAKGNADALGWLGYYSYWGSLHDVLPKDPQHTFEWTLRAADAGELFAQRNAGIVYQEGIGTPVNYALSAEYFRAAANRGDLLSRQQLPKLLREVLR